MCLVIDTCTIPSVFSADEEFLPVRRWLLEGPGKMIRGGSGYDKELAKLPRYTRLIAELAKQNKVVTVDSQEVDDVTVALKLQIPAKAFDDPHIVALVGVSGCKVVCTVDNRSERYLKDRNLYSNNKRPAIYKNSSHAHLLCDNNIIGICR